MSAKTPQSNSLHQFLNNEFFPKHFKGRSNDTRRNYSAAVNLFAKYLTRRSGVRHDEILTTELTRANLAAFWQWGPAQLDLAKSTMRSVLHRLRTLWRAAFKAGYLPDEPPAPWWWQRNLPPPPDTTAETMPPKRTLPPLPKPIVPGKRPATLGDYLPIYVLERGLQKNSAKMLRYRLSSFERALGRPAKWTDLHDTIINLWLANMLETHSPEHVRGARSGILALWRAAYEARIIGREPKRIRKIKTRSLRPQCWTMANLDQLLTTCNRLPGRMRRAKRIGNQRAVKRADFWKCWIMLGFYSGLRLGDMLALQWSDISTEGVLCVVQHKTGDATTCQLPADALAALSLLHDGKRQRVFGDLINKANAQRYFRKLVALAGVKGSTKWLRKSGASYVESEAAGSARLFLGHRSHNALALRHYVDPRVAQRLKPTPPRIEGPK